MGNDGDNLHRNNLAEWVMYVALLPLVPIVWLVSRLRRRNGSGH